MLPSVKSLSLFRKNNEDGDDNRRRNNGKKNGKPEDEDSQLPRKRIRSFPSERNQFVVHVYHRFDDHSKSADILSDIYDEFSPVSSPREDEVVFEPEPHISFLVGHYAVQYHQIEPLMEQLAKTIESFPKFTICLSKVCLFSNQENTRKFIVICDNRNNEHNNVTSNFLGTSSNNNINNLKKYELINQINQILKQYRSVISDNDNISDQNRLITINHNYSFHTSIASFLPRNDHKMIGEKICDNISNYFQQKVLIVKLDHIIVKIGHRLRKFNLYCSD